MSHNLYVCPSEHKRLKSACPTGTVSVPIFFVLHRYNHLFLYLNSMVYATELFPPPSRGSPDAEKGEKTSRPPRGKFVKSLRQFFRDPRSQFINRANRAPIKPCVVASRLFQNLNPVFDNSPIAFWLRHARNSLPAISIFITQFQQPCTFFWDEEVPLVINNHVWCRLLQVRTEKPLIMAGTSELTLKEYTKRSYNTVRGRLHRTCRLTAERR